MEEEEGRGEVARCGGRVKHPVNLREVVGFFFFFRRHLRVSVAGLSFVLCLSFNVVNSSGGIIIIK